MPDYIPTKVLLHDPDSVTNPKSLYPVTGLNAIVAGTSGDSVNIYVTNSNNQIKYQYLEIMGSTSKVGYDYLPIEFDDNTGKIDNVSLSIFDTNGLIKSDLLPGYVDDVIEIPVLTDGYPAEADVFIRETETTSGTTYHFYTRTSDNTWELGGGQTGKIYIAASSSSTSGDGSIYRCVTGDPTTAIKISENPYVFDQTATNGVSLSIENGVVTAQAVSATTQRLGTVQIDSTASNNVKLLIDGGVLSISAGMAAGTSLPGLVYAAGTAEDAAVLTSAYGNTYVVPTAKYMQDYVDAAIVGVSYATSNTAGIVQIGNNIQVNNAGVISVRDALADKPGVVCIVDTIATTPSGNTGNTGKAVTLGGITTYIGSLLTGYQKYLEAGNGISITRGTGSDTIAANYTAPLTLSGTALTVANATTGAPGVVVYTGDSSYISNETTTDANGHPIVPNAKAVKDYVAAAIQDAHVETKAPLYYDPGDGLLTASSATTGAFGVVKLTAAVAYDGSGETYSSYVVPTANAVQSALSNGLATKQDSLGFSSGVTITDGVVKAVVDSSTYPWMHLDASGIGVTAATNQRAGVVQIVETSAGIVDITNSGCVPTASAVSAFVTSEIAEMGLAGSAGYVPTSTTTSSGGAEVKLGGVRVVENTGIGLLSGNIYMKPATSSTIGGIQLAADGTGLEMAQDGVTLKIKKSLPLDVVDGSLIVSKANDATNPGVVTVLPTSADILANSAVNWAVPNAAGLISYIAEHDESLAGSGLVWSDNNLNVNVTEPVQIIDDAVTVRIATAETGTSLTSAARGAVYVRAAVRSATVIDDDDQGITLKTVPTESAVRSLVDSTSSGIINTIDARLYITYTPLNN